MKAEEQETHEKLKSRFSALIETISDGIIILTVENNGVVSDDYLFSEINEVALNILGKERSQIIDKKLTVVRSDNNQSRLIKMLGEVLETGLPVHIPAQTIKEMTNDNLYECQISKLSENELCVIFSDVTQSVTNQTLKEESDEKIKYIFDYSAIGKSLTLPTGEIQVNIKLCEMLGYSKEELMGKKWQEITHPDDLEATKVEMDALFSRVKYLSEFEKRYIRKDGSIMWGGVRSSIRWDDNGKPLYFMTSVIDITQRKQTEEALLNSERSYKFLFDYSGIGIAYFSPRGEILSINQKAAENLGGKTDDFIGKTLHDLFDKESADHFVKRIVTSMQSESTQEYEDSIPVNSETKWFQSIFNRVSNQSGEAIGVQVTSLDITQRKIDKDSLTKQNDLFASLLQLLPVGVFMVDSKDGKPLVANDTALKFLGRGILPDANRHNLSEVYRAHKTDSKDPYPPDEMPIILGMKGLKSHIDDLVVERPDGSELLLEIFGTPVFDETGKTWASLVTFLDITERKKALENLVYLSYHDFLTGLYNRRFFEEEIIRLNTERNLPITIMMGDLNGLKLINDSLGHATGDEYLKKAANVIKDTFRADDIVSRIGGDEFAILLIKTDADEAIQILNRLEAKISTENVGSIDFSIAFGYQTKTVVSENIMKVMEGAENQMYRQKLYDRESRRSKTIDMIMNALFEKSHREMSHSKRVSEICGIFAETMHFEKNNVDRIKLAGLVHDIGKIGISESVLNKPDRLDENEWEEMKKHPEIGWRILISVNEFSDVAGFVLDHHERWDGSGYPSGLKGEETSLEARMIALADAYDAMTTDRPYRKGLLPAQTILEIQKYAGRQFDPDLTRLFIEKVVPILK
jgi:diguanylate cyclase (GGDEF)-like protein/PAS domain S-box-containing protein